MQVKRTLGLTMAIIVAMLVSTPMTTAQELFLSDEIVKIDDTKHNISQICHENGFDFKRYEVTTEDGYILALDRIPPFGKKVDDDFEAPVVLLKHGIEDSSINWVINSVNKAIAFLLSKVRYDVWLGNNRGNHFSQAHNTLDPKKEAFWKFDFEEISLYDVPATVDFIL